MNKYLNFAMILLFLSSIMFKKNDLQSINVKGFIKKNNLFDIGYGLVKKNDDINYKKNIFSFNDFMIDSLYVLDIKSSMSLYRKQYEDQEKVFLLLDSLQNSDLNLLSVNFNDSLYKITFPNYLDAIDTVLHFTIYRKQYLLIYIFNSFAKSQSINRLGILIDKKNKQIVKFPDEQSTNSILVLTDLNKDKNLEYISYYPLINDTLKVYELKENQFKILNSYTTKIKRIADPFAFTIDKKSKLWKLRGN